MLPPLPSGLLVAFAAQNLASAPLGAPLPPTRRGHKRLNFVNDEIAIDSFKVDIT